MLLWKNVLYYYVPEIISIPFYLPTLPRGHFFQPIIPLLFWYSHNKLNSLKILSIIQIFYWYFPWHNWSFNTSIHCFCVSQMATTILYYYFLIFPIRDVYSSHILWVVQDQKISFGLDSASTTSSITQSSSIFSSHQLKLPPYFLFFLPSYIVRSFEKINDINGMKELWKVDVKIHHKWSVVSKTKKHFEMIVIDKDVSLLTQHAVFIVLDWFIFMSFFSYFVHLVFFIEGKSNIYVLIYFLGFA